MKYGELIERISFRLKHQGVVSLVKVGALKISEYLIPPRSGFYEELRGRIYGKKGLETGGPSAIFCRKGFIPVYNIAGTVDNMNFAGDTIWEGEIKSSLFTAEGRELGRQFIGEASDLSEFSSGAYDFLLSSEMIQHLANPLKALDEWKRVLSTNGTLVLIIPDMTRTFDHNRPLTTLEHIIEDYKRKTAEDDMTHLGEALKYHDLTMDRPAGTFEQFRKRSEDNLRYRALHHHVFTKDTAVKMCEYAGFRILSCESFKSVIVLFLGK